MQKQIFIFKQSDYTHFFYKNYSSYENTLTSAVFDKN